MMKVISFLFFILAALNSFSGRIYAQTTNQIYIAQSALGEGNGADCADAYAVTWFNNSSSWAATPATGKIGPGTTVNLCGTFNASAGTSNYLQFQGSGTNGNPITLLFQPGAVLQAPYWSGGVINFAGQSYVTVNGGTNGTIQATANGTSLANQQDNGECVINHNGGVMTGITVENLICSNLYVDSSVSDNGGEDTYGIDIADTSDLVIQNNTIHDVKWAIRDSFETGYTYSNVTVSGNNMYNMDHGYFMGDSNSTGSAALTGLYVYGNTLGSMTNWDNTADNNHHDWIHLNTNSTTTRFSQIYVYNNFASGDVGANANSGFFSYPEATAAMSGVYFFNNLYINTSSSHCFADGFISWASAGSLTAVNNTFVSNSTHCIDNGGSLPGDNGIDYSVGSVGLTMENNVMQGMTNNFVYTNGTGTSIAAVDYQDYYTASSPGWTWLTDSSTAAIITWQSDCNCDSHSIMSNPDLSGTYAPQSGSAVIAAGTNLYSMCSGQPNPGLGALCLDRAGNARRSTGAWDIGAFQYSGSSSVQYGDLNGAANGAVSIYDAELVAQYVVGLITLTSAQLQAAMVSSSTETTPTIYDAFLIAEYAVGLIAQFPVQ